VTVEALAYLAAARQARLSALACPARADAFKDRARYWLALARRARPLLLP
jgi:hypothetical protein